MFPVTSAPNGPPNDIEQYKARGSPYMCYISLAGVGFLSSSLCDQPFLSYVPFPEKNAANDPKITLNSTGVKCTPDVCSSCQRIIQSHSISLHDQLFSSYRTFSVHMIQNDIEAPKVTRGVMTVLKATISTIVLRE